MTLLTTVNPDRSLPPEVVEAEARAFYGLAEVRAISTPTRLNEVLCEIEDTGSYWHTHQELLLGAKLAWRKHARCSGRYNWQSLRLLDFRDRNTPASIAEGCFEHLRVSTNGGRLRSVISVFAHSPACSTLEAWHL